MLRTHVAGMFRGCHTGTAIKLTGGSVVACEATATDYAFKPEAVVLQDPLTLDGILLIHGNAYPGTVLLARGAGAVTKIKVGGGPQIVPPPTTHANLRALTGAVPVVQDTSAAEALQEPAPPNTAAAPLAPAHLGRGV